MLRIVKFNPNHGPDGKFASGPSAGALDQPQPEVHMVRRSTPGVTESGYPDKKALAHAGLYEISPAALTVHEYASFWGMPDGRIIGMTGPYGMAEHEEVSRAYLQRFDPEHWLDYENKANPYLSDKGFARISATKFFDSGFVVTVSLEKPDLDLATKIVRQFADTGKDGDYHVYAGNRHFYGGLRTFEDTGLRPSIGDMATETAMAKFNPNHDEAGRFTSGPGGMGFVSPNEGNLSFKQAMGKLRSNEEVEAIAKFREIDKEFGVHPKAIPALGAWSDGAENSVAYTVQPNEYEEFRRAACAKGMEANQKGILLWKAGQGDHLMRRLDLDTKDFQAVHESLSKNGVEFHTLTMYNGKVRAYVADMDPANVGIKNGIRTTVGEFHGKVTTQQGTGEFIGAETREAARREYARILGEGGEGRGLGNRQERGVHGLYRRGSDAQGKEVVEKFNPNHGPDGKFTSGASGGVATAEDERDVHFTTTGAGLGAMDWGTLKASGLYEVRRTDKLPSYAAMWATPEGELITGKNSHEEMLKPLAQAYYGEQAPETKPGELDALLDRGWARVAVISDPHISSGRLTAVIVKPGQVALANHVLSQFAQDDQSGSYTLYLGDKMISGTFQEYLTEGLHHAGVQLAKFNPNHDAQGRFSSGGGMAVLDGAELPVESDMPTPKTYPAGLGTDKEPLKLGALAKLGMHIATIADLSNVNEYRSLLATPNGTLITGDDDWMNHDAMVDKLVTVDDDLTGAWGKMVDLTHKGWSRVIAEHFSDEGLKVLATLNTDSEEVAKRVIDAFAFAKPNGEGAYNIELAGGAKYKDTFQNYREAGLRHGLYMGTLVEKFNEHHDERGRFASADGFVAAEEGYTYDAHETMDFYNTPVKDRAVWPGQSEATTKWQNSLTLDEAQDIYGYTETSQGGEKSFDKRMKDAPHIPGVYYRGLEDTDVKEFVPGATVTLANHGFVSATASPTIAARFARGFESDAALEKDSPRQSVILRMNTAAVDIRRLSHFKNQEEFLSDHNKFKVTGVQKLKDKTWLVDLIDS